MSTSEILSLLPGVVLRVVEAIEAADSLSFASCFSTAGILVDDGERHASKDSIRAWFEKGIRDANATIRVEDSGTRGEIVWLHVTMKGDYEALGITESFPLYLYFNLDHQGMIQLLRINQIKPDEPTMRAVWAASGNAEDPLADVRCDVWRTPDVPEGWAKVRMVAVGLNFHDIFTLRGYGMFDLKFPLILGNEGAGTLADGSEVVIFPVLGNPDFKGDGTLDPDRHFLGELTQGSLAEYVVVPERNLIRKPKHMSFETASVLGVAWLTAYRMLFTRSGLKKGQKMLVQGSSGGVATALIQLGHAAGMEVWSTGRTEEKRALAKQLGAHRTFAPGEELPEKVIAVFDMSGERTFKHSMDSLATGGTLISCGLHSGGRFAELDLMKLFTQGISVHGVYAGNKEDFEALVNFVGENKIKPYISKVIPLEKAADGLKMMLDGAAQGKIVVRL
jgi:NADPH:quinone reductase-like Zn-dependent oxidoreductase